METTKEKILNQINKVGLYTFMKMSGLSFTKLFTIIGMDYLDDVNVKLKFIKNILSDYGGFCFSEFYLEPIIFSESEHLYREIVCISSGHVTVDVWGGYKRQQHKGEFGVTYDNLSEDNINDIFDTVMTLYEDGELDKE
ncbi:MAG: hypothetical protein RLZ10_2647 [Bacteroidota bacterium]|jgi:hypothetical protein